MTKINFGGKHVPQELIPILDELQASFEKYRHDKNFVEELQSLYRNYANRPSLLYHAKKMSDDLGGAQIYLKREDLNHTGSHKINNVLGQALLAKYMGKKRVIAETGAGQHGVATATAAALMGMECTIYMGKEDMRRQALNVYRMQMLSAKVVEVTRGGAVLQDAVDEAFDQWMTNPQEIFYLIGSALGPEPYPEMVREFQKIIGAEIKKQIMEVEGRLPDTCIACIGGGSNAIGMFYEFIPDTDVQLIGVEAAGKGLDTGYNAASILRGKVGTFHGMTSYFLQNDKGEMANAYSISAGLDYPGIGPEHAMLYEDKRLKMVPITDDEAVKAFYYLSKTEGIIPAIESSHAVAYALKLAPTMSKDQIIVVNLSGRGDKDVAEMAVYGGLNK